MLRSSRPAAQVVFLGKIMKKSPAQISDWLNALADLPAADFRAVQ